MTDREDVSYGYAAVFLSALLIWFGSWTVLCNALVIAGTHYDTLIWCLPGATLLAILIGWFLSPRILASYSSVTPMAPPCARPLPAVERPLLAIGLVLLGLLLASVSGRFPHGALLIVTVAGLSFLAWRFVPALPVRPVAGASWSGIAAVFVLLCLLYYFGRWPDWDEANYINMAVGAQQTNGLVFQYDTMIGDGSGPIHLATYRFHSFELLGAVISTVTGLAPITVIHLVMPLPMLAALALLLFLVLKPLTGERWISVSVFGLAFLYAVTESYGTWGVHGVLRFFEGKGPLVTVLVPISAALTARWFIRRDKVDLLGLGLCHLCALGTSANGLFLTPAASAFVAATLVLTNRLQDWRETLSSVLWLAPTLAYPFILAVVGAFGQFYLPSEVTEERFPYDSFRFVTGWGWGGRFALAVLPLAVLGFVDRRLRLAAALYLPLVLVLTFNPLGWSVIAAVSGNLGFRFFWAIPAFLMAGLALDALCRHVLGSRTWLGLGVALLTLVAAIGFNAKFVEQPYRAIWGAPGLKVVPEDYAQAQAIARLAPVGCNVLVPERVAVWLATTPGAPYPAFVRSLYLRHYRFTMPPKELALRWRLYDITEGKISGALPSPSELSAAGIRLGLIAVGSNSESAKMAADLARSLGLQDRGDISGELTYWRGSCRD